MCGIHGFINSKTKAEVNTDDFLKSAFIANMLRGTDSSGIAVVTATGYSDVAKIPMAGMYLPSHKQAASLITRARSPSTASMCHVRAATSGSITYDNAHPFSLSNDDGDTIVGVHNGTLNNWKTKKNGSFYDVDSKWALGRILDEKTDAFEEFAGAFAFVWWTSAEPGVLNMARNKERPLFVAYTEDDNMVYASEAGMIHWLCGRHRIKLKGSIKELEEDKLYKFDITNPTKVIKSGELPKPKVATYNNSSYYNTYGTSGYNNTKTTMQRLEEIFDKIKNENDPVQPPLIGDQYTGSAESHITNDEIQDAYAMNVLGNKGIFTAVGADDSTGYIYGTFECDGFKGDTNAVMRDVPEDIDWATGGSWYVKVNGLTDSGNDFILIVSRPIGEVVT